MKTTILFLILFLAKMTATYSQSITINQITPTAVSGGINVNLLVTTYNGAGYLSNSYTITGNTIDLSVCYWFNVLLPVYQMNNDFFIPVTNSGTYIINVHIIHSSSQTSCDNYSMGPSESRTFLPTSRFQFLKESLSLVPNPTSGIVEFKGNELLVNQIQVFDNIGRLIKEIKAKTGATIDLSNLNNGIYLVKMEIENEAFTQKVIIQK